MMQTPTIAERVNGLCKYFDWELNSEQACTVGRELLEVDRLAFQRGVDSATPAKGNIQWL